MKKALHISIGQTVFTIEEDAYAKLDAYLKAVKAHFAQTEGGSEIVQDIESRISEQFSDAGKPVITLSDVDAVIGSMGTVEDFDRTEDESETRTEGAAARQSRKFYRNPDGKIIAGVCSGIASYLGVDALWVRIFFIVMTFLTNGFALIAYVILAIIVPEAKTASQKLEMEGSAVTIGTLSENFKERVEDLGARHSGTLSRLVAWPFDILRSCVNLAIRYLVPAARIVAGIAAMGLAIAAALGLSIAAPLLAMNADRYFGLPLTQVLSLPLEQAVIIGAYLCGIIPLAVIFVLGLSLLRRKMLMNARAAYALLAVWCVALVVTGVSGFQAGDRFQTYAKQTGLYEEVTRSIPLSSQTGTVEATGGLWVTYVQGPEAKVEVSARTNSIERIRYEEKDGVLRLWTEEENESCLFCDPGRLKATVTLPAASALTARSGSRISADGWALPATLTLLAEDGSRITANASSSQLFATANDGSSIDLAGTFATATVQSKDGSSIDLSEADIGSLNSSKLRGGWIELRDETEEE